ncbi:MAG: hypothetical protein HN576_12415 [Bacteriovoracaceae bacterium]|jgi:hypothetical protein|nr:hypothetical protein [Bacteriovoracaceae bacterium]
MKIDRLLTITILFLIQLQLVEQVQAQNIPHKKIMMLFDQKGLIKDKTANKKLKEYYNSNCKRNKPVTQKFFMSCVAKQMKLLCSEKSFMKLSTCEEVLNPKQFYAKRTRTSEAKLLLATFYTEQLVHITDHDSYFFTMDKFKKTLKGKIRNYVLGFAKGCAEGKNYILVPKNLSSRSKNSLKRIRKFFDAMTKCTKNPKSFKVFAAGNIDDDPNIDIWMINDKKTMKHLVKD